MGQRNPPLHDEWRQLLGEPLVLQINEGCYFRNCIHGGVLQWAMALPARPNNGPSCSVEYSYCPFARTSAVDVRTLANFDSKMDAAQEALARTEAGKVRG